MNPDLARELIEKPGEATTQRLFESGKGVFWVDWREGSDDIVRLAAAAMDETDFSTEWIGQTLRMRFRNRQSDVHIKPEPGGQDTTLLAVNQLIAPEFEIRFVKASDGGDTLAFMPLRRQDWRELNATFGARVNAAFGKLLPGSTFFGNDPPELPPDLAKELKLHTKNLHFARASFRLVNRAQDSAARLAAGARRARLPLREPLFGDVVLTFFHDLKPDYPAITEGEIAEYEMERDALRGIAFENLLKSVAKVHVTDTNVTGVASMQGGGEMVSCMALHDPLWIELEEERGPLVVAFTRRDQVLIATAADKAAVASLRQLAQQVDLNEATSLSRQLYQRGASGWRAT